MELKLEPGRAFALASPPFHKIFCRTWRKLPDCFNHFFYIFKILHLEGLEGVCHQSANELWERSCLQRRVQYQGLSERPQRFPAHRPTAVTTGARDWDDGTGRPPLPCHAHLPEPSAQRKDKYPSRGVRGSSSSFLSPSQASPAAAKPACREPGAREGDASVGAHRTCPCPIPLPPRPP